MKIGDKAMVSPELTGEKYWIVGEIIDVEQNPFNGIVISIKNESGRIFFGKEEHFTPVDCGTFHEPNEETFEAVVEARTGKHAGKLDVTALKSCDNDNSPINTRIISATEFFRKVNYYLDLINKGEEIVIRRKSGEMFTLTPVALNSKENK